MYIIFIALLISFILYKKFCNCKVIQINPPIEAMKNVEYRCNNNIYKLKCIK